MLGTVKANTIECRLHNRCFALAPSAKSTRQLDTWPCLEKNQSVYAWYSPDGSEPTWEPDTLLGADEFFPWLGSTGVVGATVQDLSEGVVDVEHFACIHAEEVEDHCISTKDHKLFANYTMRIEHGLVRGLRYTANLTETGPALTYGHVQVHLPLIPDLPRFWINVAKTPVDRDQTKVWGCVATPRRLLPRGGPASRMVAAAVDEVLGHLFRRFVHARFQKTFGEDVVFFKDRAWVDPKGVVGRNEGDHYVREHAKWFAQFTRASM